jgi:hypothetical protein
LTTTDSVSAPPGTYPIVPSVGTLASPVYTFNFVNGVLTVTPPGSFTIAANPSSLTIASGMSGQATITIHPMNAYQGTITVSCGQLPANVSCVASPASYSFPGSQNPDGSENDAQGTITINTNSNAIVGAVPARNSTLHAAAFLWPGSMAALVLAFKRRRLSKAGAIWPLFLLLVLGLGMLWATACGGSKGSASGNAAPGNVTLTISGSGTTASGVGTVVASVPLTVTIQ